MNMVELIEGLERASGPDRELDRAIFAALNPTRTEYCYENGKDCIHSAPCQTPHYSRSIDAALTLVPEGCQWDLLTRGNSFRADVWKPSMLRDTPPKQVRHTSPAIALCIAALKARTALSEPEGMKE